MKKYITFIILLFIFCISAAVAFADDNPIRNITALSQLRKYILDMVKNVNESSSEMMKIANMLICNAIHGKSSYVTLTDIGLVSGKVHLVNPMFLLCGVILYVIGFLILMLASFYMFDIALNIAVTLLILPLGLALWPFGWTKDKLSIMIKSIVYYTGLFIFLPLGILIGVDIVKVAAENIMAPGSDLYKAFADDNAEELSKIFGLSSLGLLKILLCYIVALRIIPLMATEFCNHFFGGSLLGNSLHDKFSQFSEILKKQTVDRFGKYGKNVAKAQAGHMIQKAGNKNGNFLDRAIYNYGKKVAKTKK